MSLLRKRFHCTVSGNTSHSQIATESLRSKVSDFTVKSNISAQSHRDDKSCATGFLLGVFAEIGVRSEAHRPPLISSKGTEVALSD